MQNWKLQSTYGRINIRSIPNNPWLQRMGKSLQRKSTWCLQTRCCRLGSNVKIESPKCKKNIMKNFSNVTNVLFSWSWYNCFHNILDDTKRNKWCKWWWRSQPRVVHLDDFSRIILETQPHQSHEHQNSNFWGQKNI